MDNLTAIVNDYMSNHKERAEKELRWFVIQRSLDEAVSLAALAKKPNGKKFSHQWRVKKVALKESQRRLLNRIEILKSVSSFEKLFILVESAIGDIDGIGELTVYDTALRIGAKLNLEPERIYLHAGTQIGAKELGIDIKEKSISVEKVPTALRRLQPREIEDVLCIYKEYFGTGKKFIGQPLSGCCN